MSRSRAAKGKAIVLQHDGPLNRIFPGGQDDFPASGQAIQRALNVLAARGRRQVEVERLDPRQFAIPVGDAVLVLIGHEPVRHDRVCRVARSDAG